MPTAENKSVTFRGHLSRVRDVAKAFPNSAAVSNALRVVLKAGQAAQRLTRRPTGRAKTARR